MLLRSTLLRSPHGFPTREGGVSKGPFASLNTSLTVGDVADDVAENVRRLSAALEATPAQVLTVHQVHGTRVLEGLRAGEGVVGEADALVTRTGGLIVGVKTADCLPILIEDRRSGAVAAVHAGWRGVMGEIVLRALEQLISAGAALDSLFVAVGPAIQACCFEVDGDLPARFASTFGPEIVRSLPGKARAHLDLGLGVRRSLERAGLAASHVDVLPQCTRCDERFFSHRRDRGVTGRHLSVIRCAPPAVDTAL
ncbi:MAG: peptidoglycan editing factor PgeF [Myxococcaceae bacterium]|nr:peptidoglycan editing factor PgeF [Myxococcaceae bacterium]